MKILRSRGNVGRYSVFTVVVILALLLLLSYRLNREMHEVYRGEVSLRIVDSHGALLSLRPNAKDEFMTPATSSTRVRELAVRSEDKYFYWHLGVNPVSTLRSVYYRLFTDRRIGGSTITQQLAKNLLHHENERTLKNKLVELCYALSIEMHTSKDEILAMYLDTAYYGNRIEGIEEASEYYYAKNSGALTDGEIVHLLALLSSPGQGLSTKEHAVHATSLAKRIGVDAPTPYTKVPTMLREAKNNPAMFELGSLVNCTTTCTLTVDRTLTEKIRDILRQNLASPKFASVKNASIAVIRVSKGDAPNQLLALVGTTDPYGNSVGSQINMALQPRPIGSTWKPFIYGVAIERGARPYTLIDDSEYRYEIGTGFAFYPKNYDGIYRGPVTLNYALSNSLNVPAVRALGFDGVDHFGTFMQEKLGFLPLQSFDTYQLSIALGGLEMNPLLLAEYFTVFPREGMLAPLSLFADGRIGELPMKKTDAAAKRIFNATTTALMNKMLSDRLMGVEQFGLESNLNLPFEDYAVKTGTTYDYHDSWTVGYTSDIVVVAWIGNSDNKAMDQLSGARGAGKLWHDVMSLLYERGDTHPKPFAEQGIVTTQTSEGMSFGLPNDNIKYSREIFSHKEIVLEPHNGDVLLFQSGMSVPLRGRVPLSWSVGSTALGHSDELFWSPTHAGMYTLTATTDSGEAISVHVEVKNPD